MKVLHFSGGKDSLACLYLLKDQWDEITVMWMNAGAPYPETVAQMEKIKALVPHFLEVRSDQSKQIEAHGFPADVVPISNTTFGVHLRPGGALIQSWGSCCGANLWEPLQAATRRLGATTVIRGQRRDDYRTSPIRNGHVEGGVTYLFPIEDWTAADVFRFLEAQKVEIPDSYRWAGTSLDCWNCTAFLDERQRELRNLPKHHPELWPEVDRRLRIIRKAIAQDTAYLDAAIGA